MAKDTIKYLKKENDDLKAQTESIMEELENVKDLVNSKETNIAKGDRRPYLLDFKQRNS
jgi:hypothetical protein